VRPGQPAVREALGRDDVWAIGLSMSSIRLIPTTGSGSSCTPTTPSM
jgi:hypothetical protein